MKKMPPLLVYLNTMTTWLYDNSKDITKVSVERATFEGACIVETATDLECIQNHITFINAFISKNFTEHGYFSQQLNEQLKFFGTGISIYLELALNEKNRKEIGTYKVNVYYSLDPKCQLDRDNNNAGAENIRIWLDANLIKILNIEDAYSYFNAGICDVMRPEVAMQLFLGTLVGSGLMAAIIMTAPTVEGNDSSDEYEWTEATIALLVLWIISTTCAACNRVWFSKKVDRLFNNIDSYLTNRDVVALNKASASSIPFFETVAFWSQLMIVLTYFNITNGSNPTHWLSLFSYFASIVPAQLIGRSTDAVIRTITHCAAARITTLRTPLLLSNNNNANNDIENGPLVASSYGTINSVPADQKEKRDKRRACIIL